MQRNSTRNGKEKLEFIGGKICFIRTGRLPGRPENNIYLVFLWGNGLSWTAAPTLFAINSPI